jgi:hypothetical protein
MKIYYQIQHPPLWSKLSYATNGFCTENSTIVDYYQSKKITATPSRSKPATTTITYLQFYSTNTPVNPHINLTQRGERRRRRRRRRRRG